MSARKTHEWDEFDIQLRQVLAPTLRHGDVVVLDNRLTRSMASARPWPPAAQLFFLPPYSPDMNPSRSPSQSSRRCWGRTPPGPSTPLSTNAIGCPFVRFTRKECENFNCNAYARHSPFSRARYLSENGGQAGHLVDREALACSAKVTKSAEREVG
jgi:hypothetical protein